MEAIGTYIVQKPPASCNDTDKTHFQMSLSELARKFHHFEAVSFERQKQSGTFSDGARDVMRLGITTLKTEEQARVITVRPSAEIQAKEIQREIEGVLDAFDAKGDTELRLAVLARISQKLMDQIE